MDLRFLVPKKERAVGTLPRIIFISPTASQPRYHKRVVQLAEFCDVHVFAFRRGYYEENTFPARIPTISLGCVRDGKYLRRISSILSAIRTITNFLKGGTDCLFYAMSLDCLIIARLSGIKRGFYEIGDLRQAEGLGRAFGVLEGLLFKNILGLVLTSRHFFTEFYQRRRLLPKDRVFIIENRLNQYLLDKRPMGKIISHDKIVIGLIGHLRYERPIELLLKFVKERPDRYKLECFGDGPLRHLVESYVCGNIRYHGSFKNPDQLPAMYEQLDLNYVVYDNRSKNVRLAIPNKIYESALFGVPIVCCEGTEVGKMAAAWGIGKMVRIDSKENFEQDMGSIDLKWLENCSRKCCSIPASELNDNGKEVIQGMLSAVIASNRHS